MSVGTVEDISNTGAKSERLELLLSDQVTESWREMQGVEGWIVGDNDTTNSRHQSLSLDGLVYTFFVQFVVSPADCLTWNACVGVCCVYLMWYTVRGTGLYVSKCYTSKT